MEFMLDSGRGALLPSWICAVFGWCFSESGNLCFD